MRAVNNTLREIILRERPLTVTNNDSLVLSPPLPLLPLFASLSIHPSFHLPFHALSIHASRSSLHASILHGRDSTKLCQVPRPLPLIAASNRRKVFIFESNRAYVHVNTNPCSSSSSPPLSFDGPFVTTNFTILDSKNFSSRPSPLARPSSLDRPVA